MSHLFGAALLASACSAQVPSTSDKLIDEIERRVRLPEGASTLKSYARHYAYEKDGKVIGVYVLSARASEREAVKRAPDYGCEEVALNGGEITSKPIPCAAEPVANEVTGGKRQWFDNLNDLPWISDGGCAIVTVCFNPSTRQAEEAFCNGEA